MIDLSPQPAELRRLHRPPEHEVESASPHVGFDARRRRTEENLAPRRLRGTRLWESFRGGMHLEEVALAPLIRARWRRLTDATFDRHAPMADQQTLVTPRRPTRIACTGSSARSPRTRASAPLQQGERGAPPLRSPPSTAPVGRKNPWAPMPSTWRYELDGVSACSRRNISTDFSTDGLAGRSPSETSPTRGRPEW